ncbi:MAG: RNA polymerase sigma-70 factor (ECF subfamily) [Planctomycetota bacterium]|jgi:RNA polymerase sigma-70 factor (ECF subfamily)
MQDLPPDATAKSLAVLSGGDSSEAARLMDAVYHELRALAGGLFRKHPGPHTLQPTALVHEAFLRVVDRTGAQFKDEAHFSALCAVAMRHILIDYARRRSASKRGGEWNRVSLMDLVNPKGGQGLDVIALNEALTELGLRSKRQVRIVECRFFAGMTISEVAHVLDVSSSTVEENWRMARAWLMVRLASGGPA